MMNQNKVFALIPAYQPDDRLAGLIKEVKAAGMEPVVVDDGSGPRYDAVFEKCAEDSLVIRYPENHGKGYALKTGLKHIGEKAGKDDVIVTMDADGQHRPQDALKVAEEAGRHLGALVLGARTFEGEVPLRSRLGNKLTALVFRLASGVKVNDTQTGLRAFDAVLGEELSHIEGDRYEYEMNVLLEAAKAGIDLIECPIETIYIGDNETSHFHVLRDSVRIYSRILKFCASSLIAFVTDYLLYTLFTLILGTGTHALAAANAAARVISSALNFQINRRYVFRSTGRFWQSAAEYFLLAAAILAGNTLVLSILVQGFGMNALLAKLVTELFFFVISWSVQRHVIFSDERKRKVVIE